MAQPLSSNQSLLTASLQPSQHPQSVGTRSKNRLHCDIVELEDIGIVSQRRQLGVLLAGERISHTNDSINVL